MAKRNYQNNYPSVTEVLSILRKIGLENWFKWNTAKFCNEESRKGKEIGLQIHEAIQSHIELKEVKVETQYGNEVMNALKGFMLFKREHPEIILKRAEIPLTSEQHKFNGTLDCIGNLKGELVLCDWKSGKVRKENDKPDIYEEHLYQTSAYVMAYNEQEKAEIRLAYILCVAKNEVAYNLLPLPREMIHSCFYEVFLPALKIYNFQKRG